MSGLCARGASVCGAILALALLTAAAAQAADPAPVPLTYGGEVRLRGEAFDNPMDLDDAADDSYQFWRLRYRLWLDARPRDGLRFHFRFGNEYRWGVHGASLGLASVRDPESRVSLDNGWAELADARRGLSLRFGRMDLLYGEGFLICDGTPADGSSSAYFDAIRARLERAGCTLDLFTAKIADEGFGAPARDEDLHGLYAQRGRYEAYALHRCKRGATIYQAGKPWEIVSPRQWTAAFGLRVSHLPKTGWYGAAEGAYELGEFEDAPPAEVADAPPDDHDDRRAWGAHARAGIALKARTHPALEVGGLWLSGDDPATATYEGFDDFCGEWPKWSELLIYTLYDGTTRLEHCDEPGVVRDAGAWTNLRAVWLEGRADLAPDLKLTARGMQAWADQPAETRGLLWGLRADWTGLPGVAVQALGEWFDPGEYFDGAGDGAWYARCQLVAAF